MVVNEKYSKEINSRNNTNAYLLKKAFSSSVNNLEWIKKRSPNGISKEKLAPRPSVISTVKWVCFQYEGIKFNVFFILLRSLVLQVSVYS